MQKAEIFPSRRWSPSVLASASASRSGPTIALDSPSGWRALRRSRRRSIACSIASRVSGRWPEGRERLLEVGTASRCAERAIALAPACRR